MANIVGQWLGWRYGFVIVAALAITTAVMLYRFVPATPRDREASFQRELGALKRTQVWLTLGTNAIGFGGLFAVYTYLASTLTEVTGAPATMIPVALALFGIGMTAGTVACSWGADRRLMPTAGLTLAFVAGDGQTLAAALNHSAFNTANAIGPWLGRLAIAGGLGWTSTGWVGAALAVGGLLFWALSFALDRRRTS